MTHLRYATLLVAVLSLGSRSGHAASGTVGGHGLHGSDLDIMVFGFLSLGFYGLRSGSSSWISILWFCLSPHLHLSVLSHLVSGLSSHFSGLCRLFPFSFFLRSLGS